MSDKYQSKNQFLKKTNIIQLEDIISIMGLNPVDGGNLFRELCCQLLKKMGFTDIHIRKGNETGRDIDARFKGKNWCFECKRYVRQIDTPQMAYKFLQLDMLSEELKPDYFVLISNASMKSILKDTVEFKKVDKNTKYSVESWTNESYNHNFNKILLSYPDTYISFINSHFSTRGKWLQEMIEDFKSRSSQYLMKNPKFFDNYCFGIAVLKKSKQKEKRSDVLSYEFVLHDLYKIFRSDLPKIPFGLNLVLVGCPMNPVSGFYDFLDKETINSLVNILSYWGVIPLYICDSYMTFGESDLSRTFFFDSGAIAVLYQLDVSYTDEGELLWPYDWLKKLRLGCIKMRNFSKRGMLSTPTIFRLYIMYSWRGDLYRRKIDPILFGGLECFLPSINYRKRYNEFVKENKSGEIISNDVIVKHPFEFHYQIGKPLADSLWKNSGMKKSFLSYAKDIESEILREMKEVKERDKFLDLTNSMVEWIYSFGWLFNKDWIDTSYKIFDGFLGEYSKYKK